MSSDNLPEELLARHRKPWITWILGFLLVFGATAWVIGPRVVSKTYTLIARYYADQAVLHVQAKKWIEANDALSLAQQWKPDDPQVIRVLADFLVAGNADPALTLHTLRQLEWMGLVNEEDYLRMGQIYVQLGEVTNAKKTLAKLSGATQKKRPALEVHANIQRLEGKIKEAEQTLRYALSLDQNDPMCRLRLALLDQQAGFIEMRKNSRDTLWQLTHGKDRAALQAIDYLSKDSQLTKAEVETLLEVSRNHPEKTQELHFNVLSAFLRVSPQTRDAVFAGEIDRHQNLGSENLAPLLYWLLKENQPQMVLAMKTGDFYTKSEILIEPYLQALGALNRWEEVDKLLAKPAGMPISSSFIALWRARATQHTDRDNLRTRQHLNIVYESSGHGRDGPMAAAAVAIAEEAGLYDLAAKFYEGLALYQPKSKVPMMEKVLEMAMRARDGNQVLEVCKRLLEVSPGNQQFADRLLYMHLVSGSELELNVIKLKPVNKGVPQRTEDLFLHALAAYRLGDLDSLRLYLDQIPQVESLSAGQRAVHAGLLSISGKVGEAFQMAERIPSLLLLKEEKRFLDRAL